MTRAIVLAGLLLAALAPGRVAHAEQLPARAKICEVLADPSAYAGRTVRLSGEVSFGFHSGFRIVGGCPGHITIVEPLHVSARPRGKEFRKFEQALLDETKHTLATMSGRIVCQPPGPAGDVMLYMDAVEQLRVLPRVRVVSASAPLPGAFSEYPKQDEVVRIWVRVKDGRVTRLRVTSGARDGFERAALRSIRSWRFAMPFLSATFETAFRYNIVKTRRLPVPDTDTVLMELPYRVVVTHFVRYKEAAGAH